VTARRGPRARFILAICVLAILIARTAISGVSALLAALILIVLSYLGASIYVRRQRVRTSRQIARFKADSDCATPAALWNGSVSFHREQLDNATAFPDVRVHPLGRMAKAFVSLGAGRAPNVDMDLAGGKLEMRADGFAWRAGSALTPFGKTSGTLFIPWSEIEAIEVRDIPFKANALGGNLAIVLADGVNLTGEFMGSQTALRDAIEAASGRSWPTST
jgi:hypothetical protein